MLLVAATGCLGGVARTGPAESRLAGPAGNVPAQIEVTNLPREAASALAASQLTREQWVEILRVSVGEGQPPMLGTYSITDRTLRFAPMFSLDPGRAYRVAFNAGAIKWSGAAGATPFVATVGLPAVARDPSTVVAHVFPSADVVPENQLRLYIHFSAPMGRRAGLDYIRLLDDTGREVIDPFLPLDAEFWNDDHTRYTVFFDP
ncbi:MAG: Ig-like domain-containing protein, partial [Vicinamibacterales bacterium]